MSEYYYCEFQAIDQPLGDKEMYVLRDLSWRAAITPTSFQNTFDLGNLKFDEALS